MSNVIDLNRVLENKKMNNEIINTVNKNSYIETVEELLKMFVENRCKEINKTVLCDTNVSYKDKIIKLAVNLQYHYLEGKFSAFPDNIERLIEGPDAYTDALKMSPYSLGIIIHRLFEDDLLSAELLILMLRINDLIFLLDKRSVVLMRSRADKNNNITHGLGYIIESNDGTSLICDVSISLE